ncbi:hypothetical protein Tco_1073876, partial [Tanacetum coccineum]
MIDPDPQNPNPNQIPPRGYDDVIHTKQSTRNQSKNSSDMNKQSIEAKELKEGEYDGDKGSVAYSDTQSFDSRSMGKSISKREVQAAMEQDLVRNIVNESVKVDSLATNDMSASGKDRISVGNVGPMPIPVEDNPIYNPNVTPVSSPKILKRGEVLTDGGNRENDGFCFNQVEKWPSLNSRDDINNEGMGSSNVVGGSIMNVDTEMRESGGIRKITTSMCEKSYGRASFARVLIKVVADKGFVDEKPVNVSNMGNIGNEWQTVSNRRYGRNDGMGNGFNGQRNGYGEGTSRGGM